MPESKFTDSQIKALDEAIAKKQANPGMQIFGDVLNAAANAAGAAAGAAAVAALVGAETKPVDPSSAAGRAPAGGFSLDDLIKARDHALRHK